MKRPNTELEVGNNNLNENGTKKVKPEEDKPDGKRLSEMIRNKKKFSSVSLESKIYKNKIFIYECFFFCFKKRAKIIVTVDDLKSVEKSIKNIDETEWQLPQFYVQDLQRVILYSTIGNKFRFFPR